MLLNPGGMDLYSEILPYNPIQATPLLTFTQPDSFSTIFSSQGEAQVKRKKKTKQTKPTSFISAVAGGRRPVTSEISQHLTPYGGAC